MPLTRASDRLVTERLTVSHPIWTDIGNLMEGVVALDVKDVHPGEPIVVRWRVEHGLGGISGQLYTVQLRIDGVLVHQRSGVPVKDATVNGGLYTVANAGGWQTETLALSQSAVARSVYRSGQKRMTAHVSTELTSDRKFEGSSRFRVVREAMDSSWWEWRVPYFQSIAWKTGYQMAGTFVNRARFAAMDLVSIELCEVRSEENPGIDPCGWEGESQARKNIAASGHADFSFARKHDWKWLMEPVYIVKGPINKTFAYAAWIEATDQFGNVYRGICSSRRSRHIYVPKSKRLAAVAAQTASLNAIAFMYLKFLSLAYKLLATYFAGIAKDPPDPDFNVHEKVPWESMALPAGDGPEQHPASTRLLRETARLAGLEQARTGIRARLIGARMLGEYAALEAQQGAYVEVEEEMQSLALRLSDLIPQVQRELEDDEHLESERFARFIDGHLPEELRRAMEADPLGRNQLFELEALARNPDVLSVVRANGPFIGPLVEALQGFVGEIVQERESVLEGEEHVRVLTRTLDESGEDWMADIQDVRRPRNQMPNC